MTEFLQTMLAHAGGAASVAIFLFAGFKYFGSKAIDQAATRAIANLNAANAADLQRDQQRFADTLETKKTEWTAAIERERQAFTHAIESEKNVWTQALERERQVFARDLEAFKAALGFDAEVHRQVAAKKVEALLEIARSGGDLVRTVANTRAGDERMPTIVAALNAHVVLVRNSEHLFKAAVANQLRAHVSKALGVSTALGAHDPGAPLRVSQIFEDHLALVRDELGVEPREAAA